MAAKERWRSSGGKLQRGKFGTDGRKGGRKTSPASSRRRGVLAGSCSECWKKVLEGGGHAMPFLCTWVCPGFSGGPSQCQIQLRGPPCQGKGPAVQPPAPCCVGPALVSPRLPCQPLPGLSWACHLRGGWEKDLRCDEERGEKQAASALHWGGGRGVFLPLHLRTGALPCQRGAAQRKDEERMWLRALALQGGQLLVRAERWATHFVNK